MSTFAPNAAAENDANPVRNQESCDFANSSSCSKRGSKFGIFTMVWNRFWDRILSIRTQSSGRGCPPYCASQGLPTILREVHIGDAAAAPSVAAVAALGRCPPYYASRSQGCPPYCATGGCPPYYASQGPRLPTILRDGVCPLYCARALIYEPFQLRWAYYDNGSSDSCFVFC